MNQGPTRAPLAPLILVSLTSIGFEIVLTRYFAIASWSEYGYWVISITMVGLATSGVVLSLFKDFFLKHCQLLLFAIPPGLMAAAAAGFYFTTIIPFNPLEFQNPDLWLDQLLNIWKYYAALFPFFFAVGIYIGLYFLAYQEEIPRIYAADLGGAGAGALLILVLMFWMHPFHLLAGLLPFLLIATFLCIPEGFKSRRNVITAAALAIFATSEFVVTYVNQADFNEYKAIYPALHVQGGKVVKEIYSPRGYYLVLDNFTERLDTDFSNNFQVLGVAGPPRTYGLYNDGNRIASLPMREDYGTSYVKAALDSFPYELLSRPRVLLIGTRGGFRLREAADLGAGSILALEPGETLFQMVRSQWPPEVFPRGLQVAISNRSPAAVSAAGGTKFDLIDIASDYLAQADANKFAFTVEAVEGYLGLLDGDGIASIPISIREFMLYAVKMLETVRTALVNAGIPDPERHVIVYRSSWSARILIAKHPFRAHQIERLRKFCDLRSFDTSYYPGIDPEKVQIWNDLPTVSFENETVLSGTDKATDDLMQEALKIFSGERGRTDPDNFFNLRPSTLDRPFFYSILRLEQLPRILKRIELIPREEIGYLINLAVLLQALLLGAIVLALPLIRWRKRRPQTEAVVKSIVYFAGLGLGFLFLEILLIEKMAFFLNDRTYAFTVVLSSMLICSGIGSFAAGRYLENPRRGIRMAAGIIAAWILAALVFLDGLLLFALSAPFTAKLALAVAVIAPLAFALGVPFPLGLFLFRGERSHFLPWAWSMNGAFSVIATPIANLVAVSFGYTVVLILSLLLYGAAVATYPATTGGNRIE